MENPIINAKPHKVIDSTAKALPQTVKAIDTALSGVIKILGYPTSFLGEYANYSLQKVKNKLSIKLNGKDNIVPPPIPKNPELKPVIIPKIASSKLKNLSFL